jgi:SAM-dependent methyltransferase
LRNKAGEDRNATPEEQAILSRFIGFGASELANTLFPRGNDPYRAGWESLGKELEAACSEADHAALARSTQYAHYTPEYIVTAIWDMLVKRGFQGGSVLEPGCGVGQFIALRPERLEGRIAFTGIEMNSIAARIARKLFPKQWIRQEDFTKATLATTYDLAIGNPPFSNRQVNAADHRELRGFSLHDWFIARAISALRPGGFAAFVTSRHTLDKTEQKARQHIAEEADLLGAVRLPAGAMSADAGTEVVLDLLVFRKRMIGELPGDQTWVETALVPDSDEGQGPLRINRYFLDNPAQVLGQHGWARSQFGLDYCCLPLAGVDLQTALSEALACIAPESRFLPPVEQRITRPELDGMRVGTAASGADLKEGSYYLHNRILHQIIGGAGQAVPIRKGEQKEGLFQKHARIIEALIPVRDAAKAVLRAQMDNQPFGRHQHRLRQAWQSFTRQFGPINLTNTTVRVNPTTGDETESRRRPNLQPFYDDPDVWLVSSIEEYDEATQTARPGPLFTERVIHAPVEPEIHSAHDALAVCLHDVGHVDLPLIAELTGCSVDDALNELGEAVYLDPEASCAGRDVWVAADELLSGAVRTKLAAAREAAHSDPRFARTAAVLERAG